MKIASNDHDNRGSKHINVRFHFIRSEVDSGNLILEYVPSAMNVADGFTKALRITQFKAWRDLLDIAPPEKRGMLNSEKFPVSDTLQIGEISEASGSSISPLRSLLASFSGLLRPLINYSQWYKGRLLASAGQESFSNR